MNTNEHQSHIDLLDTSSLVEKKAMLLSAFYMLQVRTISLIINNASLSILHVTGKNNKLDNKQFHWEPYPICC